jgi:lysophospholipase L1-like esterase
VDIDLRSDLKPLAMPSYPWLSVFEKSLTTPRLPLPALPLAAGAKVMAIGDSLMGFNNLSSVSPATSTDQAASSFHYGAVEQALSIDPRFNFDSWFDASDPLGRNISGANQGVFADHLVKTGSVPGILNRVAAALDLGPDIVILEGGTNTANSGDGGDYYGGSALTDMIAKMDAALKIIRSRGKWCILMTELPRGDWSAVDGRNALLSQFSDWIRAQEGRDGVLGIWDSFDVLAPGGVQDLTCFQPDKVHMNAKGAYLMATSGPKSLLAILQANISAGSVFNQDPTVSNLFGASVGNMAGTTGTKTGAATTGSVPTGFTLRMTRGASTQVAAKEVVNGAIERVALTITPVPDGLGLGWHHTTLTFPQITAGLPTAGQWVRSYTFVEVGNTTWIGYSRLLTQFRLGTTVIEQSYAMNGFSTDFLGQTIANRGFWLISKPMLVPNAPFDNIFCTVESGFSMSATGQPVIKFSKPILRTVADPRPAWNK